MRLYVVGRHPITELTKSNFEVVGQEDVNYQSATHAVSEFKRLWSKAHAAGSNLVFQSVPSQLCAALYAMAPLTGSSKVGFIVSRPGDRPKDRTQIWESSKALTVAEVISFVNPRALWSSGEDGIKVTVHSPMPFVYSHIEWLS